jgi:hypothetical protein
VGAAVDTGVAVDTAVEAFGFWTRVLAFPTSRFTAEPVAEVLAGEGLAVVVLGAGVVSGLVAMADTADGALVAGVAVSTDASALVTAAGEASPQAVSTPAKTTKQRRRLIRPDPHKGMV